MTTAARPSSPLPAPLPYATQAGRREVPAPAPHEIGNPDGPLMREDEVTFWLCTSAVAVTVLLMVAFAKLGGL